MTAIRTPPPGGVLVSTLRCRRDASRSTAAKLRSSGKNASKRSCSGACSATSTGNRFAERIGARQALRHAAQDVADHRGVPVLRRQVVRVQVRDERAHARRNEFRVRRRAKRARVRRNRRDRLRRNAPTAARADDRTRHRSGCRRNAGTAARTARRAATISSCESVYASIARCSAMPARIFGGSVGSIRPRTKSPIRLPSMSSASGAASSACASRFIGQNSSWEPAVGCAALTLSLRR